VIVHVELRHLVGQRLGAKDREELDIVGAGEIESGFAHAAEDVGVRGGECIDIPLPAGIRGQSELSLRRGMNGA